MLNSTLDNAKKWAEKIWVDAATLWLERSPQDYAYRKYVVEPLLAELIERIGLHPSSIVVEIGCGDGAHSIFWREKLNKLGLSAVKIFGIDLLKSLIDKAKKDAIIYQNVAFEVADVANITSIRLIHDKVGIPDIIVAMFLLQDIPDLEGVLRTIQLCLKEDGHFIIMDSEIRTVN